MLPLLEDLVKLESKLTPFSSLWRLSFGLQSFSSHIGTSFLSWQKLDGNLTLAPSSLLPHGSLFTCPCCMWAQEWINSFFFLIFLLLFEMSDLWLSTESDLSLFLLGCRFCRIVLLLCQDGTWIWAELPLISSLMGSWFWSEFLILGSAWSDY